MKKTFPWKRFLILFGIITVLLMTALTIKVLKTNRQVYIFADISECQAIVQRANDGEFSRYDTPSADKNVDGLAYTAFFAGAYSGDSCNFEIYAYEFVDSSTAEIYFQRSANKDTAGVNPNFSGGSNLVDADIVVLHGCTAYAVYMPSACENEVYQFLAGIFSIQIASF